MYTGRRFDSESGLYYYRARMYWPGLGRFLQPDPIGYADGMNMYTYVGNNPLNFVDPWGLCGKDHDKAETDEILAEVRTFGWHPSQHATSGKYDFSGNGRLNDTYIVNGKVMSANEFGNYIAGYAGVYHLGYGGWIGMRLAGNFYSNQGRFWEREDEESIRDINSGAGDAWRDRLEDDIRRNLP